MKKVQEEIMKTENDLQFEGDLQALRSGQGNINNLIIFNTCKENGNNWMMKFKRKWLNTTVKHLQGALFYNKKYSISGIKKTNRDNCMEIIYNKLIDLTITDIEVSFSDFKKLCLAEQEKEYIGQTDITYSKHGKKIIFNNVSLNDTTEDGVKQIIDKAIYKNWNNDTIEGQETDEYRFAKDLLENPEDILQKNADKQKQIIKMLSEGYTQKEIAQELNCSEANISQQIRKIRNKFCKKYGKRKNYKIKNIAELKKDVDNLLNKARTRRFKNVDKLKEEIIDLIEEFNSLDEFKITDKDIYKLFKNTTLEKTQTNIINIITGNNERAKGKLLNSLSNQTNLDLIRYIVILDGISKNLDLYINKYQNSTKIG
jgi:predicted transcriptional regulator